MHHALTDWRPTRPPLPVVTVAIAAVALSTVAIAILEQATVIPDASAVYLVAVVVVGWVGGTAAALGTAVVAFLVYDLLFTEPRLSLVVADPNELLNLVLVLLVALAVGRLAALGRERATEADRRAAEATALFAISRLLATAEATEAVAEPIVERIAREAELERVWIALGSGTLDRSLADTGSGPLPEAAIVRTLVRTPGDEPARWVRAHDPIARGSGRSAAEGDVLRVRIETGGTTYGALLAVQPSGAPAPGPATTRLLSLAADLIALGLRRDRLRQEATIAEIARRSDVLKSALLDSVSHDLRTPLASIRATAGNLADPDVAWTTESIRRAAESIDDEARRLDRLVRSVLDLSRIESGALQPDLEVHDPAELVGQAARRAAPSLDPRPLAIDIDDDAPLLSVDAVLFDAIVSNLLDNIADHTPPTTPVVIRARRGEPGRAVLTVEDGGPGVAEADLSRVFDKFQRSGRPGEGPRHGMGIGLSIVRGMTEVLGGSVTARRSELGGLAVDVELPAAADPPPDIARP